MDKFAAEGVIFTNAYATAPVCSASRSAIITGVSNEATGLGHYRSKYPIPRDAIRGFPKYLRDAGYYTTNNSKTDYNIENEGNFIAESWNESSPSAHWPNGTPFFSVFNYMDSHQSRTMTRPFRWYQEHVENQLPEERKAGTDDIAMPPIYRDSPEMRVHMTRVYNSIALCDRNIGRRLDQLRDDGHMENTIVFCLADHGEGIPRGKCNSIGFGYRASFFIWFPERYRHLAPWGTVVVTDELVSFEDLAPTILSLAGLAIPGYMTGRAFLGDQRAEQPARIFSARNRLGETNDLCRSAMDGRFVYTRNFFPHLPVLKYHKYSDVGGIQRSIRNDYHDGKLNEVQAKLVQPTRPTEYLFDIREDPWEIVNLVEDPAYESDLARLRTATYEHMRDIHDVMFIPEFEMVERAGPLCPYKARTDYAYNPLDEMIEAAELVGGGAEAIPLQIKLLEHDSDVVRYWAAVGIFAGRDILEGHTDILFDFLDDPAPFVAVEIAAALYHATRDPRAKTRIEEIIQSDLPPIYVPLAISVRQQAAA